MEPANSAPLFLPDKRPRDLAEQFRAASGCVIENLHVGVELEVAGPVADGEVAVGHLGFGRVDRHLVAGQPAVVSRHRRSVDSGTGKIQVHVKARVDVLPLVRRLDLTTLLASNVRRKKGQHRGFISSFLNKQTHPYPVLGENVVSKLSFSPLVIYGRRRHEWRQTWSVQRSFRFHHT